jgi:hypothetical protein
MRTFRLVMFGVELTPLGMRDAGEIKRGVSAFAHLLNGGTGVSGCSARARIPLGASSRPATDQCNELTPFHVEHGGLPPLCTISPPTDPRARLFGTSACHREDG